MATQGVSDVHYYYSSMASAPVLSIAAGTFIAVIKSCFIDGFGAEAAQGGWEIVYEDVGNYLLVLRSTDSSVAHPYLYIDDSDTVVARICAYESMTAIDSGTSQWGLTHTDVPLYIRKNDYSAPAVWRLIANSVCFFFFSYYRYVQGYPDAEGYFFGRYLPSDPVNDIHGFGMIASILAPPYPGGNAFNQNNFAINSLDEFHNGIVLQRAFGSATPGQVPFRKTSNTLCYQAMGGTTATQPTYPDPIFGSLRATKFLISEQLTDLIRGEMPGLLMPIVFKQPDDGTLITNCPDTPNRTLLTIRLGYGSSGNYGRALIDLTGPWDSDTVGGWASYGPYMISGTVTENFVPGAYKLRLYRESDGTLVREVWSAADGTYAFENLRGVSYSVVAIDHTDPIQTSAIQSGVVPS